MAGQYSAVTGYGVLIGRNTGTPVSHAYEPPNAFTGARKAAFRRHHGFATMG